MNMMLIYGVAFVIIVIVILLLVQSNSKGSGSSDSKAQSSLESAALAKRKGDHEQAALLYEHAVSQLSSPDSDPALLSSALAGQAECMERLGKRTESERLRTQMVQLWQSGLDKGKTSFLTDIDYQCMDADFGTSTRDVAEFYEKLLAYREKTAPQKSDEFINTVVIYSRLMRKLGETEIADQLEEHAKKLRKGGSASA